MVKYDEKNVAEIAKRYKTRTEFQKGCRGAYKAAKRLEIMEGVCSHMEQKLERWTSGKVLEEAKKYNNRTDFRKGCSGGYKYATRENILNEICSHMVVNKGFEKPREKHSIERSVKLASKYTNISEFIKDQPKVYKYLTNNGHLHEVCAHMSGIVDTKYTLKGCKEIANRYDDFSLFIKENPKMYKSLHARDWMDEVCKHMKRPKEYSHTLEKCKKVASKYDLLKDFRTKDYPHYKACVNHGWLDKCIGHMERKARILSDDELVEIAKEYRTIADLQRGDPSVYRMAARRGILDKIKAHMEPGFPGGFSKSQWVKAYPNGSYLYLIQLDDKYCKVGITGLGVKNRIKEIGCKHSKILKVCFCKDSSKIFEAEKELLKILLKKYEQPGNIYKSGNTEIFIVNNPQEFTVLLEECQQYKYLQEKPTI